MHTPCLRILLLAVVAAGPAFAQTFQWEVASLDFRGNTEMNEDALLSVIETHETPGGFWQFLYGISEKLGDPPSYYDAAAFETDIIRLTRFYRDQGFFMVRIDTSITFLEDGREVDLVFHIDEGKRSYIDTLEIRGIDNLPSVLLENINNNQFLSVGGPYSVSDIENEVGRIVGAFANNGYVRVRVDEPAVRRYASTNNISVTLTFHANERYSFGDITVVSDTTVSEHVHEDVVRRHLDFEEGDYYSEALKTSSERNLNRLGVFEATRIEHQVAPEARDSQHIPMRVFVRPRAFHELTPEVGVNDENSAFNVLTGIGYSNRNFLGDARNFSTRLRVSLQSIQDVNFPRVLKETGFEDSTLISRIELSAQVVQPYVFSNKVSLTGTISAMLDKQKYYFAPIYQARLGLNAELARFTRGSLEFNLERVDPQFPEFVDTLTRVQELAKRLDLTPQFNSIILVTLQRDKRDDLFSPSAGFFHSGSIEEAGLVPYISGGLLGSRLPFSNYFKIAGVGQWYWDPGGERSFLWATRIRGGFARVYRGTTPVPITRRFFAGGSESVRGWKSRELGAVPYVNQGGYALLEGNLEGRWHLFKDAGRFLFIDPANISIVGFFDVGDVWTEASRVRLSEFAMAAGIGFRWDTIAGPIRIDFGMRVYDPFDQTGRKWVTERRFFHDNYGLVHFGIGHAF